MEADNEFECIAVLQDHSQDVKMVAWHPSYDVRLILLEFSFIHQPISIFLALSSVIFWEQVLASCSYDDTIKIWKDDDDDWQCTATLTGHESTVWSIAFSPIGDMIGEKDLL